jgi:hypothetical protein
MIQMKGITEAEAKYVYLFKRKSFVVKVNTELF